MFKGATELSLDGKGRMAIPARYRERLQELCGGNLVLTRKFRAPCLLLHPLPAWQETAEKLRKLPTFDEQADSLRYLFIGEAEDLAMDGQGRVLLPERLRSKGGLDKRVTLVGQGANFEVWDSAQWEETLAKAERDAAELSPALQGLIL